MYKVKITASGQEKDMIRQIPKGGILGDYQFYVNEPVEEADFWVVCYQKLNGEEETCKVAPENTLFFTWEPDSTYHYSKKFLAQFGKVVSCLKKTNHRNVVMDQPGLAWYMGKIIRPDKSAYFTRHYEDIAEAIPEKTKLLSVICSNKCYTKGHRERIDFVMKLKEHYGDQLDIFGFGFNGFDDKWDTIAPYKYHICIENCSQPYYWSEKLADTFLGSAFPFYYGCTNVDKFFSQDAYRTIDVHDAEGAIKIIDAAIAEDLATKNADAIQKAKELVMTDENFFGLIVKHIQDMNPNAEKKNVTFVGDLKFFDLQKFVIIAKRYVNKFMFKFSK